MKTRLSTQNFNAYSIGKNQAQKNVAKIKQSNDSVNFTGKTGIIEKHAKKGIQIAALLASTLALTMGAMAKTPSKTVETPGSTVISRTNSEAEDTSTVKNNEKIDNTPQIDSTTTKTQNATEDKNTTKSQNTPAVTAPEIKTAKKDVQEQQKQEQTPEVQSVDNGVKGQQIDALHAQLKDIDSELTNLYVRAQEINDTDYVAAYSELEEAEELNSSEITDLKSKISSRNNDYRNMFQDELVYWGRAKENAFEAQDASTINPSNPYKHWAELQQDLGYRKMALVDIQHFYDEEVQELEAKIEQAQSEEEKSAAMQELDALHGKYTQLIANGTTIIAEVEAEIEAEKAKEPQFQAEVQKMIAHIEENIKKCDNGEYPIFVFEYPEYSEFGDKTLQDILKIYTDMRDDAIARAKKSIKSVEKEFDSTVGKLKAKLEERKGIVKQLKDLGVSESEIAENPVDSIPILIPIPKPLAPEPPIEPAPTVPPTPVAPGV